MTYQLNDNEILVTVKNDDGEVVSPSEFASAKYEISSMAGTVEFTATLGNGITIDGDRFKIKYPRTASLSAGEKFHEMQVVDNFDNHSTVLQQTIKNKATRIRE